MEEGHIGVPKPSWDSGVGIWETPPLCSSPNSPSKASPWTPDTSHYTDLWVLLGLASQAPGSLALIGGLLPTSFWGTLGECPVPMALEAPADQGTRAKPGWVWE